MRIDVKKALPQTLTIINKLRKKDSATGTDVWHKTVLKNCIWQSYSESSQSGTDVNLFQVNKIQIPQKSNNNYLPYSEWKQAGKQIEHWTVSQNDWIVLGEVTEEITSQNIVSIMTNYEPNACKIQLFNDLTLPDNSVDVKGFLQEYSSIYYIEGV